MHFNLSPCQSPSDDSMSGVFGDPRATGSQGGTQRLCHPPAGSPSSPWFLLGSSMSVREGTDSIWFLSEVLLLPKPWSPTTWSLPPTEGNLPRQDRSYGCYCARHQASG